MATWDTVAKSICIISHHATERWQHSMCIAAVTKWADSLRRKQQSHVLLSLSHLKIDRTSCNHVTWQRIMLAAFLCRQEACSPAGKAKNPDIKTWNKTGALCWKKTTCISKPRTLDDNKVLNNEIWKIIEEKPPPHDNQHDECRAETIPGISQII